MSVPQVMFSNNQQAAQALSAHLPISDHFAVRPFNHFAPEFSVWWFVPNRKEWPAFRHSKLFLQVSPLAQPNADRLYTGFYIEKGFGAEVASIPNVPKKFLLQKDWYWHEFLKHSASGAIDQTAADLAAISSCPVWLYVAAYGFNSFPDSDNPTYPPPYDSIALVLGSNDGHFQPDKRAEDILRPLNDCSNIQDVTNDLGRLNQINYFWIDLHIGIELRYHHDTSEAWNASDLWSRALAPWINWIR